MLLKREINDSNTRAHRVPRRTDAIKRNTQREIEREPTLGEWCLYIDLLPGENVIFFFSVTLLLLSYPVFFFFLLASSNFYFKSLRRIKRRVAEIDTCITHPQKCINTLGTATAKNRTRHKSTTNGARRSLRTQ